MALVERTQLNASHEILKRTMAPLMLSDKAIEQRLDLAFKALAPGTQALFPDRRP